jgi:hypothetical protein
MTASRPNPALRTGLDIVVERFVNSAAKAAAEVDKNKRWLMLMLFVEAHERAAAAIRALAAKETSHSGRETRV